MDLFLDFSYLLDCENKINYAAILNGLDGLDPKQNVSGEILKKENDVITVYFSENVEESAEKCYIYQVKITESIYKTIKIETKTQ